jgi:hypothetical protein
MTGPVREEEAKTEERRVSAEKSMGQERGEVGGLEAHRRNFGGVEAHWKRRGRNAGRRGVVGRGMQRRGRNAEKR